MKQIERLRSLMEKATPGDLTTAERAQDEFIECPICLGAGEVEARDYCNIDHKALGVQFYGIGPEFGTHEALWSECINSLPDLLSHIDALEARVEEQAPLAWTQKIEWHKPAHRAVMASVKLGSWLSAALDDPNVCAEMKTDIQEWFSAGEPMETLGQALDACRAKAEAAERALAEAVKERDALRSASTIIRQRDEAVEVLRAIDGHVSHGKMGDWSIALNEIRKLARAFIAKMGEK